MTRDKHDFKKVVPFAFLIFTIAEFIPVLAYFFPSSLPRNVLTYSQKRKLIEKRDSIRIQIHTHINNSAKTNKGSDNAPLISQRDFINSTNARLVSKKYASSFDLSKTADFKTAKLMCKFFGLSSIGTFSMLKSRLAAHATFLRTDDSLLFKDLDSTVAGLSTVQLIEACDSRGIPTTNFSFPHLKNSLVGWVQFSNSFSTIEPGFYLWSRIFLLSKIPTTN
ncbi:LETM1 and EF-hand domain-containing protein 1, mitochondrial [Smittium mucronatum]|uniref:LETM1 and EF-hand domain-containing protein 1, mitochondrial n=1 Tax=Smittium mucronatum TaxID=133383 RepID=A0A1R0H4C1_9FUNG|nr:LETM1 and EF-hand domain-containing protein 1, mitochondrial [Smittium mucronatum]